MVNSASKLTLNVYILFHTLLNVAIFPQAVRRSRNKAKQRTQETFSRVSKLKAENQILEDKVRILTQELEFHKKLFMELPSSTQDPRLQGIDLEKVFEDIPDNKDEKT